MPFRRWPLLLSLFLIVSAVVFELWRARYGVELYDEACYLINGFKMYALGDRPFAHEVSNGPRQYDLLNHYLVRPFVPYSVLFLRRAAVVVYAILLLWFVLLCFRWKVGIMAGLTYFACLTFDYFLLPTWSYNWWCRDFYLIHHCFLIMGSHSLSLNRKRAFWFMAGLSAGIAVIAYNPVSVVFVGTCALIFVSRFGSGLIWQSPRQVGRFYLLGGALLLLPHLAYLLSPAIRIDWLDALKATIGIPELNRSTSLEKSFNACLYVIRIKEFWMTLLLGVLLRVGKETFLSSRRNIGLFAAALLSCALFWAIKFKIVSHPLMLARAQVGIGVAAGLWVLWQGFQKRDFAQSLMAMTALMIAFCMATVSSNGPVALFWILPLCIVPFVAEAMPSAEPFRGEVPPLTTAVRWGAVFNLGLVLTMLGVGAVFHKLTATYRDVPPKECTTEIKVPPLTGLLTSPRRAFLIQSLHDALQGKDFVFAWHQLPGAFYFSRARSSVDTINTDFDLPEFFARQSLLRAKKDHRYPQLIARAKHEVWTWGMPFTNVLGYRPEYPFTRFAECVRHTTVIEIEELEVYEVDPNKVHFCLEQNLLASSTP